ncbi:hypothetical protein [Nannocystis pusilla]|uniref:hypothetical protein n=1 Tax=Nannocystis pusilla TaxID=889268 RepID=UPI003B821E0C
MTTASPAPQVVQPVPNASPAAVDAGADGPPDLTAVEAGQGSWGQARVVPRGAVDDGVPVPRETPGPGDTARMGQAAPAAEQASVSVTGSPGGPSWSAPMARLAVESSRRSAGAAPLRVVLVKRDGSEGESVALRGTLVVGRKQGELLFPSDEFLSPAHARLEPAPGGACASAISDLATGSMSGSRGRNRCFRAISSWSATICCGSRTCRRAAASRSSTASRPACSARRCSRPGAV